MIIEAEVPMSEMSDFSTVLRSLTQDRAGFSLTFERYEQVPKEKEAAIIEEAKGLWSEERE